jgi:prepilin-type N-terminal cleavage/methylation domain-containing protein
MLKRLYATGQSDRGFTLVEFPVVLVILGVLSGAAFSAVQEFSNQAVTTACKLDAINVETASAAYYEDNGRHATAIDNPTQSSTTLVGAKYLRQAPNSPKYTITYNPADGSVQGDVATTSCTGR